MDTYESDDKQKARYSARDRQHRLFIQSEDYRVRILSRIQDRMTEREQTQMINLLNRVRTR